MPRGYPIDIKMECGAHSSVPSLSALGTVVAPGLNKEHWTLALRRASAYEPQDWVSGYRVVVLSL